MIISILLILSNYIIDNKILYYFTVTTIVYENVGLYYMMILSFFYSFIKLSIYYKKFDIDENDYEDLLIYEKPFYKLKRFNIFIVYYIKYSKLMIKQIYVNLLCCINHNEKLKKIKICKSKMKLHLMQYNLI